MRHSSCLLLPLLFTIIACSGSSDTVSSRRDMRVYPAPPEQPRLQYLTSFSTQSEFGGEVEDGVLDDILGEEQDYSINRPYGLALRDNNIYICDTRQDAVVIGDLKERTFDYLLPLGRGALKTPINCCLDSAGNLYVADAERRQVVVFTPDLEYKHAIGGAADEKPVDVQYVNGEIWVLDIKKRHIAIYGGTDFSLLRTISGGASPESPGYLSVPTNFTVRGDRLYVSDAGDSHIEVYDLDGTFITAMGSIGDQLGNLVRPKGVAVDREGNVYVVDAAFENVQIFNADGQLLLFFGGPYQARGDMYLPAKVYIDYDHLDYFREYVDPAYTLKYLVFVTNQYGPDKVSVYGFIGDTGTEVTEE